MEAEDDGPDLNTGRMTQRTEDAFVEMMVGEDTKALDVATTSPAGTSMLEHPVFVCWCVSCGFEAPEACRNCPRCGHFVRRHQRILELPDEPPDTLSLASLRAALADVAASHDVQSSAMLLAEQGPDPGVAAAHPALAAELASLGVPPAVQRALVARGFCSLEQITLAVSASAQPEGALAAGSLGLSPAAEVLLRRLWQAAGEREAERQRLAQRRRSAQSLCQPLLSSADALLASPSAAAPSDEEEGARGLRDKVASLHLGQAAKKRLRFECCCDSSSNDSEEMMEEEDEPSTTRLAAATTTDGAKRKQCWDDAMSAIEDDSS